MRPYQRIGFLVALTLADRVVNCERAMATGAGKKTPIAELKKKADAGDVAAMVELGKRHLFFDDAKDDVEEVI